MNKKTPCTDCGGAPTIHWLEKMDAYIEVYFLPLLKPLNIIQKILSHFLAPIFIWLTPHLIKLLCLLKIAELKNEPDKKTVYRARCLWEEAKNRNIKMQEFRLSGTYNDSFMASFNRKIIFFQGLPKPWSSSSIEWMDDKKKMKDKFVPAGIPCAKGQATNRLAKGLKIFYSLNKPVITKPHTGSRSRHTTIHIDTKEQFVPAFKKAQQLSPWVMIEEELKGSVYRGTIVNNKLIAVLRRDPPAVEGDGIKTIVQLVEEENKKTIRQGPLFHKLPQAGDVSAENELQRQGLNWSSIPDKDQLVALGTKTSRGMGGGLVDVTEKTHPETATLLEYISKFLNYPYVGIDFIISDIKKSWKNQDKCGVIECNSLPFIDLHHYPSSGKPQNVAGTLWDLVFPNSLMDSQPPASHSKPR